MIPGAVKQPPKLSCVASRANRHDPRPSVRVVRNSSAGATLRNNGSGTDYGALIGTEELAKKARAG